MAKKASVFLENPLEKFSAKFIPGLKIKFWIEFLTSCLGFYQVEGNLLIFEFTLIRSSPMDCKIISSC